MECSITGNGSRLGEVAEHKTSLELADVLLEEINNKSNG